MRKTGLVGATWHGKPDPASVRQGVLTALIDYRDVLMNEYDDRIDYKTELK